MIAGHYESTITVKLNQQTKTHLTSVTSSRSYCNYYLHPVNMLDLCYHIYYYCIDDKNMQFDWLISGPPKAVLDQEIEGLFQ